MRGVKLVKVSSTTNSDRLDQLPPELNNHDKQIVVVVFIIIVGSISRSSANVSEDREEINTPTNIFTLNTFFLCCIILCLLCILEFT
jgi:hypothetical protein